MNIKQAFSIIAVTTGLAIASSASAAITSYNFANEADYVTGERGYNSGTGLYSLTKDGITVSASASAINAGVTGIYNENNIQYGGVSYAAGSEFSAYMDQGSAGLGVCSQLNVLAQCKPSNDDNVSQNEILSLFFSEAVNINSIAFVNGNHKTNFTDTKSPFKFMVSIDSGAYTAYNLTGLFTTDLYGTSFDFKLADQSTISERNKFYINTLNVPEASSIILLGLGLAGLGFTRRKKTV